MSGHHHTFASVIGLWPSVSAFASDVGVPTDRARKWHARNSVPGEWFAAVIRAAHARDLTFVTAEFLSDVAEAKRNRNKVVEHADK